MGVVIDMASFQRSRLHETAFQKVACPVCDAMTEGRACGSDVAYVCYGVDEVHSQIEWFHSREHVAVDGMPA